MALAYTTDSHWRNRAEFLGGRAAIVAFLARKWNREFDYRLIKELWGAPVKTVSPSASLMNGVTTAAIGSVPTATSFGNSTRAA